jgi:hypothetical protein
MRLLLITTLLLASGVGAASASERRLDRSKEFAYTLPDGWNVVPTLRGRTMSSCCPRTTVRAGTS